MSVFQPPGLANQPGEPYPATFRSMETVGIEPTAVCLQDRLATLGTFVPNSCGGRIRTGVKRLMRPCWDLFSSPLRSDQGGSRTHKHQALDLTAMPVRVPGPLSFLTPDC